MNVWSDDRVKRFKQLHADGHSFGIIAAEMGVSRNAAIGKASRLGLKRVVGDWPDRPPRREKPRVQNTIYKRGPPKRLGSKNEVAQLARLTGESQVYELPPERTDDQNIPHSLRRTLMGLTNETCRWPVGEPGVDLFFCGAGGADCDNGRPYCPAHSRRAFKRTPTTIVSFVPWRKWAA